MFNMTPIPLTRDFRMFAPDEFPLMFNASVAALCIVTGKYI